MDKIILQKNKIQFFYTNHYWNEFWRKAIIDESECLHKVLMQFVWLRWLKYCIIFIKISIDVVENDICDNIRRYVAHDEKIWKTERS